MRLSTKLSLSLFAIFLALLAGAALVLSSAFAPTFSNLEMRRHARNVSRIEARLQIMRTDIVSRVRDYAEWNDTRSFLIGRYPSFIRDNFTSSWLANYDLDLAIMLDDRGRVLWLSARDQNGRVIDDVYAEPLIFEARRALAVRGSPVQGSAWTTLGPVVYAAMPATGSHGDEAPHGLVLFARRITAAALSDQMQFDVRVLGMGQIPEGAAARTQRGAVSTWVEGRRTQSLIPLRDSGGNTVGAISTSRERDVVALGERVIGTALGLFAALAAIACALLWLLMRRLVVSPIEELGRDFSRQSCAADIAPVSGAEARDEIGALKRAYNQLVKRVRESRDEAQEAQRERGVAEAANQMKSQFLANMSHELRTPLNAVIGYAELTLEQLEEAPVEETRADIEKVIAAARHQLQLVNEVLDLARIEAGGMTLDVEVFDAAHLIEETARIIQPHANGNALHIECEAELGLMKSDLLRLKQCLINVASNACKFTQDGMIVLTARRLRDIGGDRIEIKIADNGIGMSPDQLKDIFQPFVQADVSITRRFGGSGLGLAITRNIVTLLGGDIRVESVLGKGSIFTLVVPAGVNAKKSAAASLALTA